MTNTTRALLSFPSARLALGAASALLALTACNQKPAEESAAPAEPVQAAVAPSVAPSAPAAPPVADMPAVPAGAKVFFIEPADRATIEGPLQNGKISVHVKMGAENIAVKPAGAVEAGSGHHHILIDPTPITAGTPVPKDEQHLHFGQGQTEATIELTPGEHVLMLQFADGLHRSYGAPLMAPIKVTAVAAGSVQAPSAAAPPAAAPATTKAK